MSAPPRERQFTPKGQMAGAANQKPALQDLPPHLKVMFDPRPMLPCVQPPKKKQCPPYTGVSQYINLFETTPPPPPTVIETLAERKNKIKDKMARLHQERNNAMALEYDPNNNAKCTTDAFRTMFIGSLSYDTTEKKLRREFEQFGPIEEVKIVTDLDGKPRGYAFVCFENEEDMTAACKRSVGKKIDGRRIITDVERGRTVKHWRPARLGGGLGGRKLTKSKKQLAEEAEKEALTQKKLREGLIYGPGPAGDARDKGGGGSSYRPMDRGGDRHGDRGRGRDSRDRGGAGGAGRDTYRTRSRSRDRYSRGDGGRYGDSRGGGGRYGDRSSGGGGGYQGGGRDYYGGAGR